MTLGAVALAVVWTVWAERNADKERDLRNLVQQRLHEWFPEDLALSGGEYGFVPRSDMFGHQRPPDVVLLHGLDEPGGIWDALVAALDGAGINGWEFRYPNDQAIDRSADLLAEHWTALEGAESVVVIGHSMGGLVIRDFVSRRRHPVATPNAVEGPAVRGIILVGTPNQGSEWARLRIWLELRELLAGAPEGEFSLFAGLRDGTGAAKIDLRPDSAFLAALNARSWPEAVPVRIIGGRLGEPTPAMADSVQALADELGASEAGVTLTQWWEETEDSLGDGVVPVASLGLPGVPAPNIVTASHRGLLAPATPHDEDPPAIAPILQILERWECSEPCAR